MAEEFTPEQKQAIALASARARLKENKIFQDYDNQPWYGKVGTTAADSGLTFGSGYSYHVLDRFLQNAGPEYQQRLEDARTRLGKAGTALEITGSVLSPITKAIGLLGGVARGAASVPVIREAGQAVVRNAPGILARMGIGAAEGGAMAGADAAIQQKDIGNEAGWGAAVGGGIPLLSKTLGGLTSFFQGTKAGSYVDAFDAGKIGGTIGQAFRSALAGRAPTAAQEELGSAASRWSQGIPGRRRANAGPIRSELADAGRVAQTSSGVNKLTPEQVTQFQKLKEIVTTSLASGRTLENLDAIRTQLDDFAEKGGEVGRMAVRLQEAVRKAVTKVEPTYGPSLGRYSAAKSAEAAGHDLRAPVSIRNSVVGGVGTLGAAASTLGAGLGYINPIVALAMVPGAIMSSPQLSGRLANAAGTIVGKTGLTPGAIAPALQDYEDSIKREWKARKRKGQ